MLTPHVSEYMTMGPYAVGPREPLLNAKRLMQKYGLRHLPVWSEGKLVGIVSERDLDLAHAFLAQVPAEEIVVEDAMTGAPYAPSPDTPIDEVVRVMVERKIGSAVVLDQGQIVGIFTATDGMRALLDALAGKLGPSAKLGPSGPPRPRRRGARSWSGR